MRTRHVPARTTTRAGALGAALAILIAACGTPSPTPSATTTTRVSSAASATPSMPVAAASPASSAASADPTPTPTPAAGCGRCGPPPSPTPTPSSALADRWEPAGTMATARRSFRAVPLLDGRVLVVGDDNTCAPGGAPAESALAELYDPAPDRWAPTGSLNAPREGFAAVRLADGRVLVTGGETGYLADAGVQPYSSTKLYDPATGRWTSTGLLHTARYAPAAARLADGRVLVAGGTYDVEPLATAEIWDPATGKWASTGRLVAPRSGGTALTLSDGRVLLSGGRRTGPDGQDGPADTIEVWEPRTGAWSVAGQGPPTADPMSLLLGDGTVLFAGGTDRTTATFYPRDPLSGAWRFDADGGRLTAVAPMPAPRADGVAVLLADGRVLVAGGADGGVDTNGGMAPVVPRLTTSAAIYDPATDRWTETTPLPAPREGGTATLLPDGTVLVAGGITDWGEPSTPWCPALTASAVRFVPAATAGAGSPAGTVPATGDVALAAVARSPADPAAAKAAATSVNAFGLDLFRRLLADPKLGLAATNAVFSPTSVALALAMARAGAKGATAAQMDAALHASGWAALGTGLGSLTQALASRDATWTDGDDVAHALALRIPNAAYAQRGWPIVSTFLDAIGAAFGAGLRLVDLGADPEAARKAINAWVSDQTNKRIPQLLGPGMVDPLTRLLLVNATYLKADWEWPFDDGGTKPAPFTRLDGSRVAVPTMRQVGGFVGARPIPYARGTGWQAVELRYRGANGTNPLAMTLILPDDLAAFEKSLTASQLDRIATALARQRDALYAGTPCPGGSGPGWACYAYDVELFMPRISIATKADLIPSLRALGMTDVFDPASADLTGTSPEKPLSIGFVVHQANIDVNETGTEAAAATAVGETGGGASPLKTITVRLNRPFLFIIRDVETGAVLFMGQVTDPSAKAGG